MFRCNFRKRFKSHFLTFFIYLILFLRFSIKLKVFDKSFRLLIEQRFNSRISRILFSNFFNIFGILILKLFKKKLALFLVDFSFDNSSTSINFQYQKKKWEKKRRKKGILKGSIRSYQQPIISKSSISLRSNPLQNLLSNIVPPHNFFLLRENYPQSYLTFSLPQYLNFHLILRECKFLKFPLSNSDKTISQLADKFHSRIFSSSLFPQDRPNFFKFLPQTFPN